MKSLRKTVIAAAGLFGLWVIGVNAGASYLMRRRRPDKPDNPMNYGIGYEEVYFDSRDHFRLCGRWIPAENPTCTIIICHGQEGSMDGLTALMVPLHEAGFNVFMFDFRAHGKSDGEQVSLGMVEKEDLLGAIDYLSKIYGIEQVGVLGFSMGAATALIAAALSPRIGAIVADSSYAALHKTIERWGSQRGIPVLVARQAAWSVLTMTSVRTEWRVDHADPLRWISHIGHRPILFIYGGNDPYITREEIIQLVSQAEGPVETWIVDGVGHRGAYSADPVEYTDRVIAFFNEHLDSSL